MRAFARVLLLCLLAPAVGVVAQEKPAAAAVTPAQSSPLSDYNKQLYTGIKEILLRSAEKMPEEKYSFKPVDSVRTFGQIVGHIASAQYTFCSLALGEKNPAPKMDAITSKADLISALKSAFAYCDKAYNSMTDVSATETVKLFGGDVPKLGALSVNNLHSVEHYGNLITYLRMNNIVPPTSDPPRPAQPQQQSQQTASPEKK